MLKNPHVERRRFISFCYSVMQGTFFVCNKITMGNTKKDVTFLTTLRLTSDTKMLNENVPSNSSERYKCQNAKINL